MRNLPGKMIGLLIGVAMLTPIAAQAQESSRDRGSQRGGGGNDNRAGGRDRGPTERSGGWQRGGDRGAMMNGDTRREAVRQGREATRAVERPAPVNPPARAERGDDQPGNQQPRNDRVGRDWDRGDNERRVDRRRDPGTTNADRRRETNRSDRDDNRSRNWDRDRRDDGNRDWGRDRDGRNDGNRRWTTDRRDWNGRDWDRRNDRWDRDWRNDRRYGWQDYRKSHRHIYRLPRYEPRYGHSYRRWSIGYRFDPWYFGANYWISDPWQYRLPAAYGPYRWVRYYDDVALVDTRTGEIVDIIYDFFF